jgi:DNA-binding MarR family transcriptional regulator
MNSQNKNAGELRQVLDWLRILVYGVRQSSMDVERKYGISGAQLFVLVQLGEREAASINELAERTMTHQSSVSVVVSKLEEKGFVRRRRDAADGRRVQIELTAAGRRLVRNAPRPYQEQLAQGLRGLPPNELRAVARSLKQIVEAAGWEARKPALFFESSTAKK